MPLQNDIYAVADTSGLWYYRPSNAQSVSQEADKEWRKAFGTFGTKSVLDPNFNFKTEYAALRKAYQVQYHADIRFVPYSEISKEPPCAGVDYKPGMSGPNHDVETVQPVVTIREEGPEVIIKPPEKIQVQEGSHTRPGLGEIDQPRSRPSLGDQEPPLYNVGPPER
jgi:hypothetical protein